MRPALAGTLAVIAGFVATVIGSTATDALLEATHVFPRSPQAMTDAMFAIASTYRGAFTILGGHVTARLAPDRPMLHAAILAGIGLLAGMAGVFAFYTVGEGKLGPAWYAFSIPLQAVPCVLLGGWLAGRRREAAR